MENIIVYWGYIGFLGTLNIRCRTIMGIQKGTMIFTTTHIGIMEKESANYCSIRFRVEGLGIMAKKMEMETTIVV